MFSTCLSKNNLVPMRERERSLLTYPMHYQEWTDLRDMHASSLKITVVSQMKSTRHNATASVNTWLIEAVVLRCPP